MHKHPIAGGVRLVWWGIVFFSCSLSDFCGISVLLLYMENQTEWLCTETSINPMDVKPKEFDSTNVLDMTPKCRRKQRIWMTPLPPYPNSVLWWNLAFHSTLVAKALSPNSCAATYPYPMNPCESTDSWELVNWRILSLMHGMCISQVACACCICQNLHLDDALIRTLSTHYTHIVRPSLVSLQSAQRLLGLLLHHP